MLHNIGLITKTTPGGGGGSDVISLSGTTGSPNYYEDVGGGFPYVAFNVKDINDPTYPGELWVIRILGSDVRIGSEWCASPPTGSTYWVRGTAISGTSPTGSALNTWLDLADTTININFIWQQLTVGSKGGVIKLEIADDSAGSNILATGYYEGFVNKTS